MKKYFHEDNNRDFFVVYFICFVLAVGIGHDFFAAIGVADFASV
jgi:hypothetical protein